MIMDSSYGHTGGVADAAVITEGALKGFVSISPTWGGMDIDSLTEICRQAYTEEEYQSLLMEERIRCGDEHSKVVPMDMGGYQVPYGVTFITSQSPVLTMSRTSIRVNPQVHRRFEDCEFIEVLFHPILRMLVIREADGTSGNDYRWDCGRRILNIPAMAFCKAVYQKMDWIMSFRFMFRGITRERDGERMMAFYLDEPQILPDKKTKEEYNLENGKAPIQYIPYHNAEVAQGKKADEAAADFGLSVTARKYRDKLINGITGDDIRKKPVLVVNPILEDLPDRKEINHELEVLLASM